MMVIRDCTKEFFRLLLSVADDDSDKATLELTNDIEERYRAKMDDWPNGCERYRL